VSDSQPSVGEGLPTTTSRRRGTGWATAAHSGAPVPGQRPRIRRGERCSRPRVTEDRGEQLTADSCADRSGSTNKSARRTTPAGSTTAPNATFAGVVGDQHPTSAHQMRQVRREDVDPIIRISSPSAAQIAKIAETAALTAGRIATPVPITPFIQASSPPRRVVRSLCRRSFLGVHERSTGMIVRGVTGAVVGALALSSGAVGDRVPRGRG
jgi:hypothetical protein